MFYYNTTDTKQVNFMENLVLSLTILRSQTNISEHQRIWLLPVNVRKHLTDGRTIGEKKKKAKKLTFKYNTCI